MPRAEVLSIQTVEQGSFLSRANAAFQQAMQEAIKANGKAQVGLTLIIEPDTKSEEGDVFKVGTKVTIKLPEVKVAEVFKANPEGVITTDLRSIHKVLRPLGDDQYEDAETGEVVDLQGRPVDPD